MATLKRDPRTGTWLVRFQLHGKQYKRSCLTTRKPVANRMLATVEETIELVRTSRLTIPKSADIGTWVLAGGKEGPSKEAKTTADSRFGALCEQYLADQKQKAETTLGTERCHISNLKRLFKSHTQLQSISLKQVKSYAEKRAREKFRGKEISPTTIRKELATFREIWAWADKNGQVNKACPFIGSNGRWKIHLEKPKEQIKFQTWIQIERRLARGGLTRHQIAEQWKSLFLDESQITDLLAYIEEYAYTPFQLPMFVFAAYTGARRSEICRSQIDDFNFEDNQILIRERKRRKSLASSTRFVPMHPKIRTVMLEWFRNHPGGQSTFTWPLQQPSPKTRGVPFPITPKRATHFFEQVLKDSVWSVLSGFHVLRHSFGSNLARTGKLPSTTIGKWMGHTTEEMRELYQHLFPQDGVEQISVLQ